MNISNVRVPRLWAGIAQSVRLATVWAIRGSNPGEGRDFLHPSRLDLGPTQRPVQWVPGFVPGGESGRSVALTAHSDLVKVKIKCVRYTPGVAQRVGRGIALLFHDRGTRRG